MLLIMKKHEANTQWTLSSYFFLLVRLSATMEQSGGLGKTSTATDSGKAKD